MMHHHELNNIEAFIKILPGLLSTIAGGTIYSAGNLALYLISYLRVIGQHQVEWNDIQLLCSVQAITQGLFSFFGGEFEKKVGTKLAATLSGLLISLGLFLTYFTVSSYYGLLLTFGFMFSAGNGLAYTFPLAYCLKWHPNHQGLVTGLVYVTKGFWTLFFMIFQSWYINPHNLNAVSFPNDQQSMNARYKTYNSFLSRNKSVFSFDSTPKNMYYRDPAILARVPEFFFWFGLIVCVIQLISAAFMSEPNVKTTYHKVESHAGHVSYIGSSKHASRCNVKGQVVTSMTFSDILKNSQFWMLWIIIFCCWQSVCFIVSYWKVIGQINYGISDHQVAKIGAALMVIKSLSNLFWGHAVDRVGFKPVMLFSTGMLFLSLSTFQFSSNLNPAMKIPVIMILFAAILACAGGVFTIITSITAKHFNFSNLRIILALLFSARAIGSLVSVRLSSVFISRIGVYGTLQLYSILAAIAFAIVLFWDSTSLSLKDM